MSLRHQHSTGNKYQVMGECNVPRNRKTSSSRVVKVKFSFSDDAVKHVQGYQLMHIPPLLAYTVPTTKKKKISLEIRNENLPIFFFFPSDHKQQMWALSLILRDVFFFFWVQFHMLSHLDKEMSSFHESYRRREFFMRFPFILFTWS